MTALQHHSARPSGSVALGRTSHLAFTLCLALTFCLGCGDVAMEGDGGPADGGLADASRDAEICGLHNTFGCGECRADRDCMSSTPLVDFSCYPPGTRAPGGPPPPPPERACEVNSDCAGDAVCVAYRNAYGDENTECRPPCTADSCDDGDRCDEAGSCVPIRCDEGYTCPLHRSCDPDAPGHGCARDRCARDADCAEDGYCVEQRCYPALGTCQAPGI